MSETTNPQLVTRDEAQKIAEKIFSYAKADETSLSLFGGQSWHLRFSRNTPSTSGATTQTSLNIRSSFGKRSGAISVNQLDEKTLLDAVKRAEELAKISPEDPERMPLLGAQTYASVDAYSQRTADEASALIAAGIAQCLEESKRSNVVAAGFVEASAGFSCTANSKGLFGYHRSTSAHFSQTSRTPDETGSGWTSASSHRLEDIDFGACAKAATEKALRSKGAKPLEPGKYTTILDPACTASVVQLLFSGMDTRSAAEGRSYFAAPGGNRIGEKLFPDAVNIYSDPTDSLVPASPWGGDGLPQSKREWLSKGTLTALPCDRFWAEKEKKEAIPSPPNFIWKTGQGSIDDLIKSTERGLLVTSLWYIRGVDPRTLLYTGLTRDGVFLIEKGQISYPVQNFRWNDSPVTLLKGVEGVTQARRIPPRESRGVNWYMPAIKVKEMVFTSVSDAV